MEFRILTNPLCDLRIGLALSGGGGKGAYEIGCLKELQRAGVTRYAALAGTSVGALNAGLVAAGKLDAAERFWRDIRPSKVLLINWRKAWLLPVWLFCAFYRWRFGAPATRHPDRSMRWLAFGLPFIYLVFLLLLVFDLLPHYPAVNVLRQAWRTTPSLFIWLLALGFLTTFAEPVAQVTLRWMMTTNDPLCDYLHQEIRPADFNRIDVPFYAVVSRLRPFTIAAMNWGGWIPDYIRIDQLEYSIALQALLQSAGLPGVFIIKDVLGEEAVDGGLCDNAPVAPLLYSKDAPLDLVIVIYLEAKDGNWTPAEWAEPRWNAYQQSLLGEPTARGIDSEYLENKRGPFNAIPGSVKLPEIIEVLPSQFLGNFFSGTLNFTSRKARALIELGRRDMNEVLRQHGWIRPDAP